MKLLIASDIHGSAYFCRRLIECIEAEKPQKVVLLGDLLYHGPRNELPREYAPKKVAEMLNAFKNDIIAVRGNCDSEVDQMLLEFPCMADYALIMLESGQQLYLTHGHLMNPDNLPNLASGSVFIYGHTHTKQVDLQEDIFLVNPGSISIPKDGIPGYALYEDGLFILKSLTKEPLAEMSSLR